MQLAIDTFLANWDRRRLPETKLVLRQCDDCGQDGTVLAVLGDADLELAKVLSKRRAWEVMHEMLAAGVRPQPNFVAQLLAADWLGGDYPSEERPDYSAARLSLVECRTWRQHGTLYLVRQPGDEPDYVVGVNTQKEAYAAYLGLLQSGGQPDPEFVASLDQAPFLMGGRPDLVVMIEVVFD